MQVIHLIVPDKGSDEAEELIGDLREEAMRNTATATDTVLRQIIDALSTE
jgi:hypothetical protein